MKRKQKLAIGANISTNPYATTISNNNYAARDKSFNYLKDLSKAKQISNIIPGVVNTIAGGISNNPELIKSGLSTTLSSLSAAPVDASSITNIYGYDNVDKYSTYTSGINPSVVAGGQSLIKGLKFGNGGKFKLDGGGAFGVIPSYTQLPDNTDYTTKAPMVPGQNYTSTPTSNGLNPMSLLAKLNPLDIGSNLQKAGMNEYGVITDSGSYLAGSILNPVGAFANWAGSGFHGQGYMKDRMGENIQNMTSENAMNKTNSTNAQQLSLDYNRLNNFNNKGGVSKMSLADGGIIPLASNAGELKGASHAQGGIDIAPNVEAEGGEVIQKSQRTGDTQVFSERDGFADVVKPLLEQKGMLEQQLQVASSHSLKLHKLHVDTKDALRKGTIARNMQKASDDVFMIKAAISQIDMQVEQIFAQQQQQNGNNTAQQPMQQGMAKGGRLARTGIEIPPPVNYPYSTEQTPQLYVEPVISTVGQSNIINNDVYNPRFTVPSDESLSLYNQSNVPYISNTTVQSNLAFKKQTGRQSKNIDTRINIPFDWSKVKLNGLQDVAIPLIENIEQSKLAGKMERVNIPKMEHLKYNPNEFRFNSDYELNKLYTNANDTTQELRKNSSNPYYANAMKANIMRDVNTKAGEVIDKNNKLNLEVLRENNAGFNRTNEYNLNIDNTNNQANYNKTMADLTRRGSILGNTTNRAIEFANNKRQLALDYKRLDTEGVKYANTIGTKWQDAILAGTANERVKNSLDILKTIGNKATLNNNETQALEDSWNEIVRHHKSNNLMLPNELVESMKQRGYEVNGYTFKKK